MKQTSEEALAEIFNQITSIPGIWLPAQPPNRPAARPTSGTAYLVYMRYSETAPGAADAEQMYWNALHATPLAAIKALATINGILTEDRALTNHIHSALNQRFLSKVLRDKVAEFKLDGPAIGVVFNKIGCLLMIRHLILYGDRSTGAQSAVEALGDLAILSNEFIDPNAEQRPSQSITMNAMLALLPTWDIYNPRDVAYALCRSFTILTKLLPGEDPEVKKLATKVGIDRHNIMIDGMSLGDFVAVVFGLFAHGRNAENPDRAAFDMRYTFSKVGLRTGILEKLVDARGRTIEEFEKLLDEHGPQTYTSFVKELSERSFLIDNLNCFRRFPLLRIDPNIVLILDLQFLADLLTSGVYWHIFDSLPSQKRRHFRELWGRLFEIYAVGVMEPFYPPPAGVFRSNVKFNGGQIDAILDLGDAVIVFEIKASLLTEPAKRRAKEADFIADFNLKFIQNEKGKPKGAGQLAISCKAVEEGGVEVATPHCRIYPVLVSDEPAVESAFFNTFLNEEFQKIIPQRSRIQPITAMSIDELEGLLPYVSQNAFSWPELLDFRFSGTAVRELSVHQGVYDLARCKRIPPLRNDSMQAQFGEIWEIIRSRYGTKPTEEAPCPTDKAL